MIKMFISILLLSSSFTAQAYKSGNELLWACKGGPEGDVAATFKQIHCFGYLSGMLDGMQLIFGAKPSSKLFCPPKQGISVDQQVRIVTKWLENNPEKLHEGARVSVLIALVKAFPCK